MLHAGLGSEDGLGPVRPQRRREHLPEGGDRVPTEGVYPQLVLLSQCEHVMTWAPPPPPGLLLQCHRGGRAAALLMDSDALPEHALRVARHL